MKIAVIICTYDRKNMSSKNYLINMFKMLENQTYKKFKVFIIGDNYTNNEEFIKLCKNYKGEIFYENSKIHFREGYFKINYNKWTCGGMNSRYIGITKAINEKYDYYFHLDDDDYWFPNHIENAVNYIKEFPLVDFMITKSYYWDKILPREHNQIKIKKYNNFNIKKENSVHSSWIINLKTIGNILCENYKKRLDIINQFKNNKIKEYQFIPFDANLLNIFSDLQNKNILKAICILEKTVKKTSDINIPL